MGVAAGEVRNLVEQLDWVCEMVDVSGALTCASWKWTRLVKSLSSTSVRDRIKYHLGKTKSVAKWWLFGSVGVFEIDKRTDVQVHAHHEESYLSVDERGQSEDFFALPVDHAEVSCTRCTLSFGKKVGEGRET